MPVKISAKRGNRNNSSKKSNLLSSNGNDHKNIFTKNSILALDSIFFYEEVPNSEIEEIICVEKNVNGKDTYMIKLKNQSYKNVKDIKRSEFKNYFNGEQVFKYFSKSTFRPVINDLFLAEEKILSSITSKDQKSYLIKWAFLPVGYSTWEYEATQKSIQEYEGPHKLIPPRKVSFDFDTIKFASDFEFNKIHVEVVKMILQKYLKAENEKRNQHFALLGGTGSTMRREILASYIYITNQHSCDYPILFVVDEDLIPFIKEEFEYYTGNYCLSIKNNKREIDEIRKTCWFYPNTKVTIYDGIVISYDAIPYMIDLLEETTFLIICADATSNKANFNTISNICIDFIQDEEIRQPTNENEQLKIIEEYLKISTLNSILTVSLFTAFLKLPNGSTFLDSYCEPTRYCQEEIIPCKLTPEQRTKYDSIISSNFDSIDQSMVNSISLIIDHPAFDQPTFSVEEITLDNLWNFLQRSGKILFFHEFVKKAIFEDKRTLIITTNEILFNFIQKYFQLLGKQYQIYDPEEDDRNSYSKEIQFILCFIEPRGNFGWTHLGIDWIFSLTSYVNPINRNTNWMHRNTKGFVYKKITVFRFIVENTFEVSMSITDTPSNINEYPNIGFYLRMTYACPIRLLYQRSRIFPFFLKQQKNSDSIEISQDYIDEFEPCMLEKANSVMLPTTSLQIETDESESDEDSKTAKVHFLQFSEHTQKLITTLNFEDDLNFVNDQEWSQKLTESVFHVISKVCWGNWDLMAYKMPVDISPGFIKEVAYLFLDHLLKITDQEYKIATQFVSKFSPSIDANTSKLILESITNFMHAYLSKNRNELNYRLDRIEDMMVLSMVLARSNVRNLPHDIHVPDDCMDSIPSIQWTKEDDKKLLYNVYCNGFNEFGSEFSQKYSFGSISCRFHALIQAYIPEIPHLTGYKPNKKTRPSTPKPTAAAAAPKGKVNSSKSLVKISKKSPAASTTTTTTTAATKATTTTTTAANKATTLTAAKAASTEPAKAIKKPKKVVDIDIETSSSSDDFAPTPSPTSSPPPPKKKLKRIHHVWSKDEQKDFIQLIVDYGTNLSINDFRSLLPLKNITDKDITTLKTKLIEYEKSGHDDKYLFDPPALSVLSQSFNFYKKLNKLKINEFYCEDQETIKAIKFWGIGRSSRSPLLQKVFNSNMILISSLEVEIDKIKNRSFYSNSQSKHKSKSKVSFRVKLKYNKNEMKNSYSNENLNANANNNNSSSNGFELKPNFSFDSIHGRNVIFPVALSNDISIISLGDIDHNAGFYNEAFIYPVGYTATCKYNEMTLTCSIKKIDNRPFFTVEDETTNRTDVSSSGKTPEEAWHDFFVNILKFPKFSFDLWRVPGHELFGLTFPLTKRLIQSLPGASECASYKPYAFRTPVEALEMDGVLSPLENKEEAFEAYETGLIDNNYEEEQEKEQQQQEDEEQQKQKQEPDDDEPLEAVKKDSAANKQKRNPNKHYNDAENEENNDDDEEPLETVKKDSAANKQKRNPFKYYNDEYDDEDKESTKATIRSYRASQIRQTRKRKKESSDDDDENDEDYVQGGYKKSKHKQRGRGGRSNESRYSSQQRRPVRQSLMNHRNEDNSDDSNEDEIITKTVPDVQKGQARQTLKNHSNEDRINETNRATSKHKPQIRLKVVKDSSNDDVHDESAKDDKTETVKIEHNYEQKKQEVKEPIKQRSKNSNTTKITADNKTQNDEYISDEIEPKEKVEVKQKASIDKYEKETREPKEQIKLRQQIEIVKSDRGENEPKEQIKLKHNEMQKQKSTIDRHEHKMNEPKGQAKLEHKDNNINKHDVNENEHKGQAKLKQSEIQKSTMNIIKSDQDRNEQTQTNDLLNMNSNNNAESTDKNGQDKPKPKPLIAARARDLIKLGSHSSNQKDREDQQEQERHSDKINKKSKELLSSKLKSKLKKYGYYHNEDSEKVDDYSSKEESDDVYVGRGIYSNRFKLMKSSNLLNASELFSRGSLKIRDDSHDKTQRNDSSKQKGALNVHHDDSNAKSSKARSGSTKQKLQIEIENDNDSYSDDNNRNDDGEFIVKSTSNRKNTKVEARTALNDDRSVCQISNESESNAKAAKVKSTPNINDLLYNDDETDNQKPPDLSKTKSQPQIGSSEIKEPIKLKNKNKVKVIDLRSDKYKSPPRNQEGKTPPTTPIKSEDGTTTTSAGAAASYANDNGGDANLNDDFADDENYKNDDSLESKEEDESRNRINLNVDVDDDDELLQPKIMYDDSNPALLSDNENDLFDKRGVSFDKMNDSENKEKVRIKLSDFYSSENEKESENKDEDQFCQPSLPDIDDQQEDEEENFDDEHQKIEEEEEDLNETENQQNGEEEDQIETENFNETENQQNNGDEEEDQNLDAIDNPSTPKSRVDDEELQPTVKQDQPKQRKKKKDKQDDYSGNIYSYYQDNEEDDGDNNEDSDDGEFISNSVYRLQRMLSNKPPSKRGRKRKSSSPPPPSSSSDLRKIEEQQDDDDEFDDDDYEKKKKSDKKDKLYKYPLKVTRTRRAMQTRSTEVHRKPKKKIESDYEFDYDNQGQETNYGGREEDSEITGTNTAEIDKATTLDDYDANDAENDSTAGSNADADADADETADAGDDGEFVDSDSEPTKQTRKKATKKKAKESKEKEDDKDVGWQLVMRPNFSSRRKRQNRDVYGNWITKNKKSEENDRAYSQNSPERLSSSSPPPAAAATSSSSASSASNRSRSKGSDSNTKPELHFDFSLLADRMKEAGEFGNNEISFNSKDLFRHINPAAHPDSYKNELKKFGDTILNGSDSIREILGFNQQSAHGTWKKNGSPLDDQK